LKALERKFKVEKTCEKYIRERGQQELVLNNKIMSSEDAKMKYRVNDFNGKHPSNSILGTSVAAEKIPGQMFEYEIGLSSAEEFQTGAQSKRGRTHLKRRAHQMKNSRYDESFVTDFSGN